MGGPFGLAVALMTMTTSEIPRPGPSRPLIVMAHADTDGCRTDDASTGATLSVSITLRNAGGAPTAHLIAWPVAAPGVLGVPAPAAFGAIQPGDTATRTVLFAGHAACARPESVGVVLMDRGVSLGVLRIPLRPDQDGRD
jgi:hypothetical protein